MCVRDSVCVTESVSVRVQECASVCMRDSVSA